MELGIFERQLRLMVLLTQNREYSLEELCRKLDMSRRTLYRYLELFRDIGFEVVKQGNVYRLHRGRGAHVAARARYGLRHGCTGASFAP